jgi:hypothetical protein
MNNNSFYLITVDLTREMDDGTIIEYIQNNALAIDVKTDISHQHFDIFFSNNEVLHEEVKDSIRPVDKFNHKKVLKLKESLIQHELDLDLTVDSLLKDDDTFIHIPIFNKLPYRQITQLLNLAMCQSARKDVIKKELVVCIDERCMADYQHYILSHIIDMYLINTPVPNMQVLPTYAAFAKRVKNFKCY